MFIRSTTGCYACKTRRKKCDETKPKCLRCSKSKIDCEYEYVSPTGKSTKKRTKPAPRPTSEQAKKSETQPANLGTIPEQTGISEASLGLFDYPLVPSFDISLPLDTDWETALYLPATMPSLDPLAIRAIPSPSVVLQQPVASARANLSSDQASLFNALFSLGETNCPEQSNSLSNALTHSTPRVGQNPHTTSPYQSISYSACAEISDSRPHGYAESDDDGDLEGVGEIFCQAPLELVHTVDSNSLPFILHSFAQWLPLAVFDPLKIIHRAKEAIINQFSQSLASRHRLILISKLMTMLTKSWALDERGKTMLELLTGEIWHNMAGYRVQGWPVSEEERQRANAALDNTLELMGIQVVTSPLSVILRFLQSAAPVFLSACPLPHPPNLSEILLEPGVNLRHFAAVDIAASVTTGRPLLCRYYIPWSLEFCDEFMKRKEHQGLQWLIGIPDQFILLFGYMNGLKEDAEAAGTTVSPRIIEQIEEDMKRIIIVPCEGRDPSLVIGRTVVQECWRQAVFIYLYMALCGAHALDPRVEKAQKGFMKLVNGTRPGRNPDTFLIIAMLIAGVAVTKPSYRQTIKSRILGLPECVNPNTAGNDSLLMLQDIWARTESEGRVARWEDLGEACRRVTGI
ncbi:Lysine biosynthesis regulatory protein LYS14 [Saccharomyces cerevisiae S288c] [Rhizoctonia solani]|uniref:Lysine biosynthesis regulatory protein LYS14 [Saccharomyces cerevisiae S288c] n=1 Tax=Rhizoctonia solani TaxID=456999 RepID=A0A0K6FZQ1_9AGAM|nr:Lysine biosynthesis regulatory protein LYS14 [Saccharomyces cerevisiae S288c] [Rhizoctonia solani]